MTQQFGVYDGGSIVATIDGEAVEAPGDGDFVTVAYNADYCSMLVGVDGSVVLNLLNDRTGTIELNVMPGSIGSLILDGIRRRREAREPPFTFEFGVKNIISGEQWVARQCALQSAAGPTYGAEAGAETWTLAFVKIEGDRALLPQ